MLELDTKALLEPNRIYDMPSIGRCSCPDEPVLKHRATRIGAIRLAQPPCFSEVVLESGALQGRHRFAVDRKVVVALAPPAEVGRRPHTQDGPDVLAAATDVGHDVVARPTRKRLPILGMEIRGVLRDLSVFAIDLVVEAPGGIGAFVRQSDSGRPAKRHRPETGTRLSITRNPERAES